MALLYVKMDVLEKKRKAVRQIINSLAADIKKEQGCLDAVFCQNAANETEILLLTIWTDRNALDVYLNSVQYTVFSGIRSLLSKEPKIKICEDESLPHRGR